MANKTDIWMPLFIGDYLADTAHLDAERSGCYLHWLMHYWRKGPLPNDPEKLLSIGKLRSKNAPSIIQALLNDFFTLGEDQCWHQKRSDSEIAQWSAKRLNAKEKATRAGRSRWKTRDASSIAQAVPDVCPSPSPSTAQEKASAKALVRSVPPEDLAGTLPLVDGTLYDVSKQRVREWSQAFPTVDVRQELCQMKCWFDANPTRRKTYRGMARFIVNWLSKEQDKPKGGLGGNRAQERANGNAAAVRRALESLNHEGSLSAGGGEAGGSQRHDLRVVYDRASQVAD